MNVMVTPATAALVAASEFAPAVLPSFQLPTVAMPLAFVVAEPPVRDPFGCDNGEPFRSPPLLSAYCRLLPASRRGGPWVLGSRGGGEVWGNYSLDYSVVVVTKRSV